MNRLTSLNVSKLGDEEETELCVRDCIRGRAHLQFRVVRTGVGANANVALQGDGRKRGAHSGSGFIPEESTPVDRGLIGIVGEARRRVRSAVEDALVEVVQARKVGFAATRVQLVDAVHIARRDHAEAILGCNCLCEVRFGERNRVLAFFAEFGGRKLIARELRVEEGGRHGEGVDRCLGNGEEKSRSPEKRAP